MNKMKKYGLSGLCAALALFVSLGANATVFDFDAEYNGGSFSLDAGSDNPVGQLLLAGDSFNYNLQTVGTDFWKVDTADSFFPFLAFVISEPEDRTGSYTLNLLLDGISQFAQGATPVVNSSVHMGTNQVALAAGLMFDEIVLDYDLLAVSGAGQTTISNFSGGLIGIPGGFGETISYNREQINPAPAPAGIALVGLGLMILGWGRRRRA